MSFQNGQQAAQRAAQQAQRDAQQAQRAAQQAHLNAHQVSQQAHRKVQAGRSRSGFGTFVRVVVTLVVLAAVVGVVVYILTSGS